MGLFDDLVKTFNKTGIQDGINEVGKELEKTVNLVGGELKNLNTSDKTTVKTVPSEYSHFPQFNCLIKDVTTKNIDKYHRCTIDYEESTLEKIEEYRSQVVNAGYAKATDVRYEKGNEYIIIDPDGTYMHLVFHVKH